MNLKYLVVFCFLSLQAKSAIEKKMSFGDVSFLANSQDVQISTTEGMPEVPTKVVLLETTSKDFPKVEVEKVWSNQQITLNWFISNGQKCRCREETLKDKKVVQEYSGNHEIEYVGDYRSKHIFRVKIPLVKIRNGKTTTLKKVVLRSDTASSFSTDLEVAERAILIVLPSEFSEAKNSLISFYEKKSFSVYFIEDSQTISIRENLRKKIKNLHKKNKISHTLFIGDSSLISPYYLETRFDSVTPSDYPYFKIGGENDYIPDIIGSRLSIQSLEQLDGFLKKLNSRELNGPIISIGVSSNEGANPNDYEYVESIIGNVSTRNNQIHLNQDNDNSNPYNFLLALNSGVDFFNYVGHGSGFSWPSFRSEVRVSDLENWRVTKKNPIILDVACQNGKFNGRGSIGETLISGHRKFNFENGASAYVGGSVDISWDPPAIFAQGVSEALGQNPRLSIGEGVMQGYLHLLEMHSDLEDVIDHLEWTHIQGDPTASIR